MFSRRCQRRCDRIRRLCLDKAIIDSLFKCWVNSTALRSSLNVCCAYK
ncbi:MAG: hypothetical protein WBA41_25630 [Rivularia sp. (in: cyanobacteria)]